MKRIILSLLALFLLPTLSYAACPAGTYFTTSGDNCVLVSPAYPLPTYQGGSSYTNITTNANTVVKSSSGTFAGLIVNTAGTTSTATVFDNTACSGTKIGTFSTLTQTSISVNALASTGICVTTAGGAAADITVLWR